mmetsp:Transcript_27491/g.75719  ORF Transcript_27491/g.75719 Transcript_27491/m.75719 type:complete len:96 (-) Transcript_27491:62-349(-)
MMRNMIANCSHGVSIEPGVQDCILEEYDLNGRLSKTIPYHGAIPPEEIHQVETLPTGDCPPGFPSRRQLRGVNSAGVGAASTLWYSQGNATRSSN